MTLFCQNDRMTHELRSRPNFSILGSMYAKNSSNSSFGSISRTPLQQGHTWPVQPAYAG